MRNIDEEDTIRIYTHRNQVVPTYGTERIVCRNLQVEPPSRTVSRRNFYRFARTLEICVYLAIGIMFTLALTTGTVLPEGVLK